MRYGKSGTKVWDRPESERPEGKLASLSMH